MQFNPIEYPMTLADPLMISGHSAWVEHIPFAFTLVEMLRPRRLVELGVHAGDSYCAFCQACVQLGQTAEYFAVDTWQGDKHAGNYSQEILPALKAHHDPKYGTFSKLLQMEFDTALVQFEDRSIDLLHIDGLHTYDAAMHDFVTWLPKVSERGVILFHDTTNLRADFGVHRVWAELAARYPHFHFEHGLGLGVLAVGEEIPAGLNALVKANDEETKRIRSFYVRLGREIAMRGQYGNVIKGVFSAQSLVNQWKQHTRQSIAAQSQDIRVAFADPEGFAKMLVQDIHALASADLNLRKQLQALHVQNSV